MKKSIIALLYIFLSVPLMAGHDDTKINNTNQDILLICNNLRDSINDLIKTLQSIVDEKSALAACKQLEKDCKAVNIATEQLTIEARKIDERLNKTNTNKQRKIKIDVRKQYDEIYDLESKSLCLMEMIARQNFYNCPQLEKLILSHASYLRQFVPKYKTK